MKLESSNTSVVTSETMVAEEFSIGNLGVILELLRSKMYSNPIRTVVQEISSNARDAHREVKKGHIPFDIKLPTIADPIFYVRDYGPGITPDRISNVFVQYGNSTKRSDNSQTGGFGLGAKSPFAYSDTFNVESITPNEFGQMMKRTYVCVIDETKCGKMLQMDSEETTEEQGTKISMAVRPNDVNRFQQWTRDVISTWNINGENRPNILGLADGFSWHSFTPLIGGTSASGDWSVSIGKDSGDPPKGVFAYIDGIPYTVELSSMNISGDRLTRLFGKHVRLSFKTGEVSVSATRDKLDYSQNTINTIKRRLAEIFDNLRAEFEKKLNTEKNLWDANVTYCDIRGEFKEIIGDVKWNGCTIEGESFRVTNAAVSSFVMELGELRCKNNQVIAYNKNTMLTEGVSIKNVRGRVRTLFQDNPNVKMIYVVQWRDPSIGNYAPLADEQKEWRDEFNFDKMEPLQLATIEPQKVERQYTSSGGTGNKRPMVRVRKFSGYDDGYLKSWPEAAETDISEVSGLYVFLRERQAKLLNGMIIQTVDLEVICSTLGLDVYGIPERYSNLIHEDLIPLDEKLLEEYDDVVIKAERAICQSCEMYKYDYTYALDDATRNLINANVSKVSPLIQQWIQLTKEANKAGPFVPVAQLIAKYLQIDKKLSLNSDALKAAVKEVEDAFPLLTDICLNHNSWRERPMTSRKEAILKYLAS